MINRKENRQRSARSSSGNADSTKRGTNVNPLHTADDKDRVERALALRRVAWDAAAAHDALHFVNTDQDDWSLGDFFESGERQISDQVDPWISLACSDPGR